MAAPRSSGTVFSKPATPTKDSFTYTSCYCEENVHLLCQSLADSGHAHSDLSDLFVIFISNPKRKIPLWQQQAGEGRDGALVVWDYHVICLQISPETRDRSSGALVWDLDSLLPFPVSLQQYARGTLWAGQAHPVALAEEYRRLFRVIRAPLFCQHFASDRSHMLKASGEWLAPPPKYPCIAAEDGTTNNLESYIRMRTEDAGTDFGAASLWSAPFGIVLQEGALLGLIGKGQTALAQSRHLNMNLVP